MGAFSAKHSFVHYIVRDSTLFIVCGVVSLTMVTDIGALQKEVGALDELKSQLFLEYVDLHSVKVQLES